MKKKKNPIRYISIKLPAAAPHYPMDETGVKNLPNYTPQYLKRHGAKLFKLLMNDVPSTLYGELVRLMKAAKELN